MVRWGEVCDVAPLPRTAFPARPSYDACIGPKCQIALACHGNGDVLLRGAASSVFMHIKDDLGRIRMID